MKHFLIKCNTPSANTISNHSIVLDLDETLVHTFDDESRLIGLNVMTDSDFLEVRRRLYIIDVDDPVTKRGEGNYIRMWGILRPGLKDFLNFCFSYFKMVTIWTAGRSSYALKIVQELYKVIGREPHIVYSFDDCLDESGSCSTKDLKKIISECPKNMSIEHTFMIDDRLYNFEANPGNGILIPAFAPHQSKKSLTDTSDKALYKLKAWLMREDVIKAEDIRLLDRGHIFSD